MNVLVQHPSEIWSFEVCKKWEKTKKYSDFHGYNIPNNDILRLKLKFILLVKFKISIL